MDKNKLDIFLEVFKDAAFPFLTADLGRYFDVRDDIDPNNISSYLLIPIPTDLPVEKKNAFISAVRGVIRTIDVPDSVVDVFLKSEFISSIEQKQQTEFEHIIRKEGMFFLTEKNNNLVWEEETVWPALYSTFVNHLLNLTSFHTVLISKRVDEMESGLKKSGLSSNNLNILSEYPRNLPTGIQYAFASLGAWIGGAINLQYFGYYASIRQIHFAELNRRYLGMVNYSEDESSNLSDSGIIGLPATLVLPLFEGQQNGSIFGSISIDEPNMANLPKKSFFETQDIENELALPGFILDKYYRATFRARKPSSYALYGSKTLLRDHYKDFYDQIEFDELLRCKHYSAPIIDVEGIEQIESLIKNIPIHSDSGLFYRGQRKLYMIERHDDVRSMLFADSCSSEPSLITSAARDSSYHYDAMHFSLRYFIEQKILKKGDLILAEKWREMAADPTCKLDMAIMALAQHYGIPTHGLDITNSLDVALWFATNIFEMDKDSGISHYKKMEKSDWPAEKSEWPVIIVCQTVTHSISGSIHDCQELEEFGFKAKRPIVQHASFFQGGHSDHQNRLAESVICVFRIPPREHLTKCSYSSLFPSPDEDSAYKLMLDFSSSPEFGKEWGKYVNRFHG